ncbi:elongation factor 4 [Blattabacterium sp. (Cryptocercus kyebangensis)]|uniref:translation elongation factor 4 n=1 Tax=Blattabacterium sp. (Cryptocercus kyebangensis) TaxID=298656 RepID=UPI000D7C47F6|nr:translation elongation factor 4 [Blattabacterium sp. (Cryptocercus kyebangensis)]AWU43517.1 elongation factor 4 [Blattabacterium sp. (Cryptocercus kyebangensis)]
MHYIRNFCIIAHIDHGKSTLADRLLEFTKTVPEGYRHQLLDDMDLERERGITIKSHAIQMEYKYKNQEYKLNLIDTPGHVDFSYEVSRSISACEGALLVVDCTKSVQAQTISNLYLALKKNLVIIPILNKIDLSNSRSEDVIEEIIELVKCKSEDIISVSAKNGLGIKDVLDKIVTHIPPPNGDNKAPLQAMIFDSFYNSFTGVVAYFRVKNGIIQKGQKLRFMSTEKIYCAYEIGILKLKRISKNKIEAGDVGYVVSGIKNTYEVKVGDTITDAKNPSLKAISGFEEVKPMVFASIYPINSDKYEELRSSIERLQLNDASLTFSSESSPALGFGFHCGFLGVLHMEVVKERLEREYGITVIITIPNVSYRVFMKKKLNKVIIVNNPSDFPEMEKIQRIEEPYVLVSVITKENFIGNVISLCIGKRGNMIGDQHYLTSCRIKVTFEIPLSEIIFDFYDKLKTISKGYASFDYHFLGYKNSDLKKITVLINHQKVDPLSLLVHKDKVFFIARKICKELSILIPKHQFSIPIQVSVSGKIIARETIKSLRKNVTAKCYGGDVSRKRKLLEKQKKGKKKMRQIGKVEIPSSTFVNFLKIN